MSHQLILKFNLTLPVGLTLATSTNRVCSFIDWMNLLPFLFPSFHWSLLFSSILIPLLPRLLLLVYLHMILLLFIQLVFVMDLFLSTLADVLSLASSPGSVPSPTLLPTWIKHGANATFFLNLMPKPCHGTLQLSSLDTWTFVPGKNATTTDIDLPDLSATCQSLMDSGQLFRGHAKFKNVFDTRNQLSLHTCVLRHVSAHGLKSLLAPSSLKAHH